MHHGLFDRMMTWTRLFLQRTDIQFSDGEGEAPYAVQVQPPTPEHEEEQQQTRERMDVAPMEHAYPEDAQAFRASAVSFDFVYSTRYTADGEEKAWTGGFYLSFEGWEDDLYIDPDDIARRKEAGVRKSSLEEITAYQLDCDRMGCGEAAWYVYPEGERPPFIYYHDGDEGIAFASLDEYMTLGARHAFLRGWQSAVVDPKGKKKVGARAAVPALKALRARGLAPGLPREELARRLEARGVEKTMAEDLIAWLGDDVLLLFPAGATSRGRAHFHAGARLPLASRR